VSVFVREHVGRREGCKLADMMDVPDAQMRRLGRWDHSRMTQHYSTGLSRQGRAWQVMDPSRINLFHFIHLVTYRLGNYYLERECLSSADELQKLIFPLTEATDAANEKNGPDSSLVSSHHTTGRRISTRQIFRLTAVESLYFQASAIRGICREIEGRSQTRDEPRMVSISRVIPHVAHVLQEQYRAVQTTLISTINRTKSGSIISILRFNN